VDAASWKRWRETSARSDCGFTPFAERIIDQIGALVPAEGAEVHMAIGGIACPGCGEFLERYSGDYTSMRLYCPQCGTRAGYVVAEDHGTPIDGPAHPY
jgi:hypothetical protein